MKHDLRVIDTPQRVADVTPIWAAHYIGIPYKHKGRDRNGLDDWGLYRMIISEQFSIALPSFMKETDDYVVQDVRENYDKTDVYKAPHVALIQPTWGKCPVFGVVISETRALTMDRGKKSCVVNLKQFPHEVYRYITWEEMKCRNS